MLVVTSSDCYCSIITFEPNELGNPLQASVMFPGTADPSGDGKATPCETSPGTNCSSTNEQDNSPPGPSQHADSPAEKHSVDYTSHAASPTTQAASPTGKPRRIRPTMISSSVSSEVSSPGKQAKEEKGADTQTVQLQPQPKPGPRRVDLITLASYKKKTPSSTQ